MPFSGWDAGEKGRVEGLWRNRPDTYEDVWGEVVGFILWSNEEGAMRCSRSCCSW